MLHPAAACLPCGQLEWRGLEAGLLCRLCAEPRVSLFVWGELVYEPSGPQSPDLPGPAALQMMSALGPGSPVGAVCWPCCSPGFTPHGGGGGRLRAAGPGPASGGEGGREVGGWRRASLRLGGWPQVPCSAPRAPWLFSLPLPSFPAHPSVHPSIYCSGDGAACGLWAGPGAGLGVCVWGEQSSLSRPQEWGPGNGGQAATRGLLSWNLGSEGGRSL